MTPDPIASLRDRLARDPAMRAIVSAILDRGDRNGALPGRMTIHCRSREDLQAVISLLSPAAVRTGSAGDLTAKLDLERADARLREEGGEEIGLAQVLYAAAGRRPRNLRQEIAGLGERAGAVASALAARHKGAANRFLQEAARQLPSCRGELFDLCGSGDLARLENELDLTARCIELAERNEQPVRLANFARRATGSTKGIRAGDRRYVRIADALLTHVPQLAERVAQEGLGGHADRRRMALECLNIFRNETPIDVLCWGRFVLEKQGRRLNAPAFHHEFGEPYRLLLQHLRDARVSELHADRILSIENETTFNDYTDWLRATSRNEIVLLSEGQANWAVVRLYRLLAEAAPSIPLAHWGDMDRFGILILRSLRRRTALPIEPCWMDVATFERCAAAALPLAGTEREEIARLLANSDGDVCSELLRAIEESGRWLEQEAVAEELIGGIEPQHRPTRT